MTSYAERLAHLLRSRGATEVHALPDRDTASIRKAFRLIDGAETFVHLDASAIAAFNTRGQTTFSVEAMYRDCQEDAVIVVSDPDMHFDDHAIPEIGAEDYANNREEPHDFRDVPVSEIADNIIADNLENTGTLQENIDLGFIDADGIRAMIAEGVRRGRAEEYGWLEGVPVDLSN